MTWIDVVVIALGLALGYWAVSTFLFPSAPPEQPKPEPPPAPRRVARAAWDEVLQVSAQAGAAEIRDAYRRLISQYHPDKVNNLGQEFRDLATRKSQEITAAYTQAMRERGEQP